MNSGSRALTVTEIIDERPLSRFQIVAVMLCGVVLLLDGFDTQCMGVLVAPISEDLHIPISAFGPILSAGLIGLMVAAMSSGLIADRWGRRWVVICSTLTFGMFTILTARATSYNQLVIFRFLTGLGLGGAMPNVVSLASEYSPKRLQTVLVTALFCGMPLGALISALSASVLIPAWGWRSVLYLGGALPFAMAFLLIKVLPESVRFLAVKGAAADRIRQVIGKIAPELAMAPLNLSVPTEGRRVAGLPVKHLFTDGRAVGTILLWIPFFMNLLTLYFIVLWLPALLRQAGLPASAGFAGVAFFSIGGIIGSLGQGRVMNGLGSSRTILGEFGVSALLIGVHAYSGASFLLTMTVTFILGVCIQGAQGGLNALSASFYPTAVRSTGVGWALGVGRVGSILGPVLAGIMLSIGWTPQQIFLAGAVPALCAAVAVMASNMLLRSESNAYSVPADLRQVPASH